MNLKKALVVFTLLIFTYIFLYFENNALVTTKFDLSFSGLPSGFNNYRILQISDLHGKEFGKSNKTLISKIKKISPNIIVLTGDLINSTDYNEKAFLNLIDELIDICPVYFVTGNHEMNLTECQSMDRKLEERNVTVLRNAPVTIHKNGDSILLLGLDDPQLLYKSENEQNKRVLSEELDNIINADNKNMFKILLSHRPEQFELYAGYDIDLVFAGHAHGGQFRLPFIGGLYAPSQGLFPKYDGGKYVLNNSTMIVSRGLGNGSIPQRIFNRPEIVVVTINKN